MDPVEEKLYAIAGQEVASRKMSPGIMAKALADADGDERRAAAAYIKLRVAQLRAEHEARVSAEAAKAGPLLAVVIRYSFDRLAIPHNIRPKGIIHAGAEVSHSALNRFDLLNYDTI